MHVHVCVYVGIYYNVCVHVPTCTYMYTVHVRTQKYLWFRVMNGFMWQGVIIFLLIARGDWYLWPGHCSSSITQRASSTSWCHNGGTQSLQRHRWRPGNLDRSCNKRCDLIGQEEVYKSHNSTCKFSCSIVFVTCLQLVYNDLNWLDTA